MAGRLSGPHVPRIQEDLRSLSRATPDVYGSQARGQLSSNRSFRATRRIREADMNGYLPYRDSGPAPRFGGVRGGQADILRGES